jgi:hypothetical protein
MLVARSLLFGYNNVLINVSLVCGSLEYAWLTFSFFSIHCVVVIIEMWDGHVAKIGLFKVPSVYHLL